MKSYPEYDSPEQRWTAPVRDKVPPSPQRDVWLAFGETLERVRPNGDNEKLLQKLGAELRTHSRISPPSRFGRRLELFAALVAIAALLAIAVVNNLRSPAVPTADPQIATSDTAHWEDELAVQSAALEQEILEHASAEPIDVEFSALHGDIRALSQEIDNAQL